MKLGARLVWGVVGLAGLTAALAHQQLPGGAQGNEPARPTSNDQRTAVVVELFTSEGCSSCPPADALLARLAKAQPVAGAEVIALKEHVDYWNHLGWRDPYSSAQFSARQNAYARALGNDGVYTPQMIVDGRTEFVGSAEGRARQAIAQAARATKTQVQLEWATGTEAGRAGPLRIRIEALRGTTPGDAAEVYLAITEDNLHSEVARGENAGRSFDHIAVVRRLERLGQADARGATPFSAEPVPAIAGGWKRENLRAVVFVQESRSRRVLAAAGVSFPKQ